MKAALFPEDYLLVVEDEEGMAELLEERLREENHPVKVAKTGREGLEFIGRRVPALILLDYALPDMDALFFVNQLMKEHGSAPPFVVMTAHGGEEIAVEMMKRGARDYLVKDANFLSRIVEAVKRNMHELKKEKEFLRLSEELEARTIEMDGFFDAAFDLLVVIDSQGNLRRVNPRWEDTLGIDSRDLLGKPFLFFIHPEDRLIAEEVFFGERRDRTPGIVECRLLIPEDDFRWVEWSTVRADGVVFAEGRDVTYRRQYEEELKRAKEETENASRERTEFFSMIGHEFRTPLSSVLGYTELLEDTILDIDQRDYVGSISRNTENLIELINDLLDFSRLESGKLSLEKIPFSLKDCAGDVIRVFEPRARQKKIALLLIIDEGIPGKMLGDSMRLRQILVNLVGNAVKFTLQGSVELSVSGHPEPTTDQPSRWRMRFRIADTGIGIPAEALPRLFQPFSQARTSTSREFGGTGLGLALCRLLAQTMEGEIEVESEPGRGSVFTAVIMLEEPEREE